MAIMMTDLDFETADSLLESDRARVLTIVEFCSIMTRRLGLLAGKPQEELPEPLRFEFPPFLAG